MEVFITNKRKEAITVYNVMRKPDRKGKAICINAADRVDILIRSTLNQLHRVKSMGVCQFCHLFGYIHYAKRRIVTPWRKVIKLIFKHCHLWT